MTGSGLERNVSSSWGARVGSGGEKGTSSLGSSRHRHSLHPEAPGLPWCLDTLSLTARSLEEESRRHTAVGPLPARTWAIGIAYVLSKCFRVPVATM